VTAKQLQAKVFKEVRARGFRPANTLPLPDLERSVRPAEEIAARLLALHALYSWVGRRANDAPTAGLKKFIERNELRDRLTGAEAAMLDMPRPAARKVHIASMHVRLESMSSLAWVLGFEVEPQCAFAETPFRVMIDDFLPGHAGTISEFLTDCTPRPAADVIAVEYRVRCAHNAVRLAQTGLKTAPTFFRMPIHLAAIEGRHRGLAWCLSPGVDWDETDLAA
jgi:hypothetical protein